MICLGTLTFDSVAQAPHLVTVSAALQSAVSQSCLIDYWMLYISEAYYFLNCVTEYY